MTAFLRSLTTDLRERQILPAVVLLVVLAILIPVAAAIFLSSSSAPAPVSVPPIDTATPAGAPSLAQENAALNAAPTQKSVVYQGAEPNPFRQAPSASKRTSSTVTAKGTGSTSASGTGSTSTSGSTTGSRPPSSGTTPAVAAKRLADDQAYRVDLTSTDASGTQSVHGATRLSAFPSSAPAFVYTGVLRGAAKAVFVVLGDTSSIVTTGSAECLPAANDCEVLELAPGASVSLSAAPSDKLVLDSIGVKTYSSRSAAAKARRASSKAGDALVIAAHYPALAHFSYALGIDAVVHHG